MRLISKLLTTASLVAAPIAWATTVDFEGGGGVGISGDAAVIKSTTCGGRYLFIPHSGCSAMILGIAPIANPTTAFATAILNSPGGFSQLEFFYGVRPQSGVTIEIFDGPNGTGNSIGFQNGLVGTSCTDGSYQFCRWHAASMVPSGTGRSVVITARDQRLMLDDLVFTPSQVDLAVSSHTLPPRNCAARYPVGNPFEPVTGTKSQTIDLGVSLGGVPLTLIYDSGRALRSAATAGRLPSFGGGWTASWLRSVVSMSAAPGGAQPPYVSFRPDGREESFVASKAATTPQAWTAYSGDADFLQLIDSTTLTYNGVHEGVVEKNTFSEGSWRPAKYAAASGGALGVITSDASHPLLLVGRQVAGLPLQLFDDFGRAVTFQYQVIPANGDPYADAKVVAMTLPGNRSIQFGYSDSGNLTTITWPDGTTTGLAYQDPASTNRLWTGVIDEANKRFSTFTYDSAGRAVATEHAGGVEAHSVTYGQPPELGTTRSFDAVNQRWITRYAFTQPSGVTVTGPNGTVTEVAATQVANYNVPTMFSQPGGAGCAPSTSTQGFDSTGNLAWRNDFNGNRTCYASDQIRNLEASRVEGLGAASACDTVLPANASLPAGARKISTTWHPAWRKQIQVAEPRRRTTYVYNGQPDPFNGGSTASCAPAIATLPDGSPIAVLCKQVEQATTDGNGALGLSATVDSTVPVRVQRWTYNQYGQVLTAIDPLSNTTTNSYYTDTTTDHTQGDLATVTNALNQVIASYTKYNPAGQWLERIDANGVATTRTFDARLRPTSTTTAGATVSFDYWPTGLIKQITMPDASTVLYGYDDAHRLTSVSDALGNSITYTLDNNGTRTSEEIKDPTGRLARTLMRVPDALNRIQQVTGRP